MQIKAKGGARLCGSGRTAGEMYLESGCQSGGANIEKFLVDVPMIVDPAEWGLSAIGITTFTDENGVVHVLDWVGESHYRAMADFIEEARLKGVSRKISPTNPIEGLTSESKLYLMHPKAAVTNASALLTPPDFACPCGHNHRPQDGCIGLGWHIPPNDGGNGRKLAEGKSYQVKTLLEPEPEYALAVFMIAPITALTIIAHPDKDMQDAREKRARQSSLPVFISEE